MGYYAALFSSRLKDEAIGYSQMATKMEKGAALQPGFLGMESVRGPDRRGITISYWRDLESIRAWSKNADHQEAKAKGRSEWYESYQVRIAYIDEEWRG